MGARKIAHLRGPGLRQRVSFWNDSCPSVLREMPKKKQDIEHEACNIWHGLAVTNKQHTAKMPHTHLILVLLLRTFMVENMKSGAESGERWRYYVNPYFGTRVELHLQLPSLRLTKRATSPQTNDSSITTTTATKKAAHSITKTQTLQRTTIHWDIKGD
jgi:hypothetical protein